MFNVLLFFLGFLAVETNRRHHICNTPMVEAFYEMCDDSLTLVLTIEPCELSRNAAFNWSFTMIPRKNIDRLYSKVTIWKESVTVSDLRYVLCSGADDEYDFCGALKGETVNFFHDHRGFKIRLPQGLYTIKMNLLVGEKEELLTCFLMALNVNAPTV